MKHTKKNPIRRLTVLLLTMAVAFSFTAVPCGVYAFDNDSTRSLPHTGATWKSWAQTDSAWSNEPLVDGTNIRMGGYGCLITSLAMGAKSYQAVLYGEINDTVTPKTTLARCKAAGALTSDGSFIWSRTSSVFFDLAWQSGWKEEGLTTVSTLTAKVEEYLDKTDAEYLVMVSFGGAHYVIADHMSGSTLYVYDPAVGAVTTLQAALNRSSSYVPTGFYYFKYNYVMRGDVTGDDAVDSTDARMILQYFTGTLGTLPFASVGDFNGDGQIDSTDARLVLANFNGE